MDEGSKPLTAFTVGLLGLYKCDQMSIGLTNAHSTIQWLMETCLRDLNFNWCIIYLDNIVIFSKDLANHLVRLQAMFQKLEQAGLKLKPSKCKLFCRQITYLRHNVSAQGIVTGEGKIDAIKNWSTPPLLLKSEVFLGLQGIVVGSIPKFTQVPQPMHKLMSSENAGRKKATVTWNNRSQQAFDELKCLCTTAPTLCLC